MTVEQARSLTATTVAANDSACAFTTAGPMAKTLPRIEVGLGLGNVLTNDSGSD